jgi:hypothetical protein
LEGDDVEVVENHVISKPPEAAFLDDNDGLRILLFHAFVTPRWSTAAIYPIIVSIPVLQKRLDVPRTCHTADDIEDCLG